jgi:hypothetical protein
VLAEDAWRAIGEVPSILERLVRLERALDHRRSRSRRLGRLLSARREPPSGGILARRSRPAIWRPGSGPRGVAGASRDGSAGVRGRHGDRAVPGGDQLSRTRWPLACTTPGTGRSRAWRRVSSRTISVP